MSKKCKSGDLQRQSAGQPKKVASKRRGNSFNTTERDEYYTQPKDIQWAISKIPDLKGRKWLDPAGGDGRWLDYLPAGCEAWDIEPRSSKVKKVADSLTEAWSGYSIIGNPPFSLLPQFVNKALAECGECWFICQASVVGGRLTKGTIDKAYCIKKSAGKFWVPALKFCIESTGQTKDVFAVWAHFRRLKLGEASRLLKVYYPYKAECIDRGPYFNYAIGQMFDMPEFLIAE